MLGKLLSQNQCMSQCRVRVRLRKLGNGIVLLEWYLWKCDVFDNIFSHSGNKLKECSDN